MKIMPSVLPAHPRAFYRMEVKVIVTIITGWKPAATDYFEKPALFTY